MDYLETAAGAWIFLCRVPLLVFFTLRFPQDLYHCPSTLLRCLSLRRTSGETASKHTGLSCAASSTSASSGGGSSASAPQPDCASIDLRFAARVGIDNAQDGLPREDKITIRRYPYERHGRVGRGAHHSVGCGYTLISSLRRQNTFFALITELDILHELRS
ncbi:hypothetical protein B0H16DRAFT_1563510 [Mycena metata]|uniref:Uncharacterized protein n=1 Tax=Mycena metata TaxID=1033252 RepID=A0AAD7IFY9_9AGAR|nr:hypothetical protein B0H16DRAFT_1563510 [Mycena metata]